MLDLNKYLRLMVEKQASDLFFSTDSPVQIKIEGVLRPIGDKPLEPGVTRELAESMMTDKQREIFDEVMEMNFSHNLKDMGRFRVNIYRQRGDVAMVIRYVRNKIPSLQELNLPESLQDLVMLRSGLVLIVGATGAGKSTSLASMIEYRNQRATGHILTIEDPIEFMHTNKRSLINQREVGVDTLCYENALMNGLREAPDVILIGEIRDRQTMEQAIRYSETGHLCLSTLHANNSVQAIEHIANFFLDSELKKIAQDLSQNLKAIVSQRLVRDVNKKFLPATEVLINTPYISELIGRGDFKEIREAMEQSSDPHTHSFDENLLELYSAGKISEEEVLHNADSRNNVTLKMKLLAPS
ncbi:PilT/PilU family type 4a pilus ATPase [Marinobacterium sp. YM272]|uniref:PilT/PilU family type 4a pilus ATPase n=1 Tax=Marinobacterium sp. YM272 TaxID=3421654 RepID=UPI003D7F73C0